MFDTLTDLVEYYKRKGIEEISGNWVHLKQVNCFSFVFLSSLLDDVDATHPNVKETSQKLNKQKLNLDY